MRKVKFLKDLSDLKEENFDYEFAFKDRETGLFVDMFNEKKSYNEIIERCTVCLSGHLISKYNWRDIGQASIEYNMSIKQVDSIIYPETEIRIGRRVYTAPNKTASLFEVKKWIDFLFNNERWVNDNFKVLYLPDF